MASNSDIARLVQDFASQLEAIVSRRSNEAFAARFDALKAELVGEVSRGAAPKRGRVGRPLGSRANYAAELKPCPVCGTPNKARRFSYLCENDRTAENLSKFKGAARKGAAAPAAKRGPGRPPKRGPGRPPKVLPA